MLTLSIQPVAASLQMGIDNAMKKQVSKRIWRGSFFFTFS
jgi:hypothetical protein